MLPYNNVPEYNWGQETGKPREFIQNYNIAIFVGCPRSSRRNMFFGATKDLQARHKTRSKPSCKRKLYRHSQGSLLS